MRARQALAVSLAVGMAAFGCNAPSNQAPRTGGTQEQMNLIMNNPHIPPDQKESIRADIEQQKQRLNKK